MDVSHILQENWFTAKEAKIYLSALELWNSPASSIARHCSENRITVYTILKELCSQGIAKESTRDKVKYYEVLSPKLLINSQKSKLKKLEDSLPEFMALANNHINKPKVYFYDGFEQLKKLFHEIIYTDETDISEPFRSFLWTSDMDPKFEKFLEEEFIPWRLKNERKTKSIVTKASSKYNNYTKEKHDTIVIDDPIFDMWNEIVLYWKAKVAILLYSNKEMSGFVIESQTLFNGLKNIFNLLWKAHK